MEHSTTGKFIFTYLHICISCLPTRRAKIHVEHSTPGEFHIYIFTYLHIYIYIYRVYRLYVEHSTPGDFFSNLLISLCIFFVYTHTRG